MAKEKNFENRVKRFLESVGIYALGTPRQKMQVDPVGYYEKRWGSKMTVSGLPDLHIVVSNRSLEIELKAPEGRASDLQKRMIHQITMCGCQGYVLYEYEDDIPTNDGFGFYMDYDQFKDVIKEYASLT